MSLLIWESLPRSSVKVLLTHLSEIEDPHEPWRVAHPLSEVQLLVVCATVSDCDDYDAIADWGESNLDVLRRHLPYHHGVPGGRWLTLLMNRIEPSWTATPSRFLSPQCSPTNARSASSRWKKRASCSGVGSPVKRP